MQEKAPFTGWGQPPGSVAWHPYVEEDQEAQSTYASQQGEPRQAPEHGAWLTSTATFLVGLTVGDSADRWALLGFQLLERGRAVTGGASSAESDSMQFETLPFDNGALWCTERPAPTLVIARSDAAPGTADDIDGVPVEFVDLELAEIASPLGEVVHPNGSTSLDHIVLNTDSLERTCESVERVLGLPLLRVRESGEGAGQIRQGFHRFTDPREKSAEPARGCILEVVQGPSRPTGSAGSQVVGAHVFGAVANTGRLDDLAADLGESLMSTPRPAVQPGRSIATVRSAADLPIAFAFMTPDLRH